ncbi:MAG: SPOR domain-containing protein [Alphaproteobacteria bacterium]|nr:SPOR domain-containing protein [Alphaproteobacteria bacterium]
MIDRKPPELFAQPPVRSDFTRVQHRPLLGRRRIMLLALLVGIAGGLIAYWQFGTDAGEAPVEIPTIKAEGPVKQRPEQPGGIEIPHQNETVFQRIDNTSTGKQPVVEHLLPPPEEPKPVSAEASTTAASVPSPAPVSPVTPSPGANAVEPESLAGVAAASPQSTEKPETPDASPLSSVETPSKPAETKSPAPAPKAVTKPKTTGNLPKEMFTGQPVKGFFVQLGSFPSQETAKTQLAKLQKKYADTLGEVHLQLKRVDLGTKGVYFRIQGGPMQDAKARSVCATLWSQKAPCIVVRP